MLQPKIPLLSDKHVPQLDALRGLAMLLVISYHYFPHFNVVKIGWSGIDIFFVLSGFLLTSRLLPYISQKRITAKFYKNRFLRIVPLYFTFLLVFFLAWFFLSSSQTLVQNPFYAHHWWQFLLFIQNWVYITDPQSSAEYLNHFWSLAVEEQYYICFPAIIFLLSKAKYLFNFSLILILIVVFSRCYFFITTEHVDYLKIYWNSFFRLDSFFIGILLYSLLMIENEKFISLLKYIFVLSSTVLIIGICISGNFNKDAPFIVTIGHTLVSIVSAYIIYLIVVKKTGITYSFFSSRFLIFTGEISYGLYILHWPIYLLGFKYVRMMYTILHIPANDSIIQNTNVIVSLALSYLFGYLSFTYYESFFMKFKVRYK